MSIVERDEYYTPSDIANRLARLADVANPSLIADFSAGQGELLRAAAKRWPGATLLANDIAHHRRVLRTVGDNPITQTSCDFFREESMSRSGALRAARGRVDLILANPPFSCRGAAKRTARLGAVSIQGSTAGVYLTICLQYLAKGGSLVAVVPAAFRSSEKDKSIRTLLRRAGSLRFHDRLRRTTFEDCRPATIIIEFKLKKAINPLLVVPKKHLQGDRVPIGEAMFFVRGATPNATHKSGSRQRFLHTTGIRNGTARPTLKHVRKGGRRVAGSLVLIPRVGRPDVGKIVRFEAKKSVVLSDCLFALVARSPSQADHAAQLIRHNWSRFVGQFGGTGAPYTTIARMTATLKQIGIDRVCPVDPIRAERVRSNPQALAL